MQLHPKKKWRTPREKETVESKSCAILDFQIDRFTELTYNGGPMGQGEISVEPDSKERQILKKAFKAKDLIMIKKNQMLKDKKFLVTYIEEHLSLNEIGKTTFTLQEVE